MQEVNKVIQLVVENSQSFLDTLVLSQRLQDEVHLLLVHTLIFPAAVYLFSILPKLVGDVHDAQLLAFLFLEFFRIFLDIGECVALAHLLLDDFASLAVAAQLFQLQMMCLYLVSTMHVLMLPAFLHVTP